MDLETQMLDLYKQVQKLQERLDDIETQLNCSSSESDTVDLIEEEIHWIVKMVHRLFCYH